MDQVSSLPSLNHLSTQDYLGSISHHLPSPNHLSQDYLGSISQLARPAFTQREPHLDSLSLGTAASPRLLLRPSRVKVPTLPQRDSPPTAPPPDHAMGPQPDTSYLREPRKIPRREGTEETRSPETAGPTLGTCGREAGCLISDPLEVLYGNENSALTAARLARQAWRMEKKEREPPPHYVSFHCLTPQLPSLAQTQPQSTYPPLCLEDHCDGGEKTSPAPRASAQNPPPAAHPSVCAFSRLQTQAKKVSVGSDGRVVLSQPGPTGMVSVRISGCRSSFRQRRASRTSFLPPIAEI